MAATMKRRAFLWLGGAAALGAYWPATPAALVNDVSTLNPVTVGEVQRPADTDEVRAAIRTTRRGISIGGGRYSMGGQVAARDSLHLDMRALKQVVWFDPPQQRIRVQAGMTWRDLQDVIDARDLSARIMQSYSNFTVGGSLSVNCHGRYVGRGAMINAVRAVQLVTPGGDVLELSRTHETDLFAAVSGGYGGLGVITEVELDLEPNTRIERVVQDVALAQYPAYFQRDILGNGRMVLHNADLRPPHFNAPRAISWVRSDKPLTRSERLTPRGLDYKLNRSVIWSVSELPGGAYLREGVVDRALLSGPAVLWRNFEASADAASLEPRSRRLSTYLLQEYFIPPENFASFAHAMAQILKRYRVNALNVSIRHAAADTVSLLKWAATEVFSFVLYYKQLNQPQADAAAGLWTRELIDAALANGGRYYLPYRLHATPAQFARAYPEAAAFQRLKQRVDPDQRMRNLLWDKYLGT